MHAQLGSGNQLGQLIVKMARATRLKITRHIVSPGAVLPTGTRDSPVITVVTDGVDYGLQVGWGLAHARVELCARC